MELKLLHDLVREQLLARFLYLRFRFGLIGSFQLQCDVLANADVANAGKSNVFHVARNGLSLRIQQSWQGHDVNGGAEFHGRNLRMCGVRLNEFSEECIQK